MGCAKKIMIQITRAARTSPSPQSHFPYPLMSSCERCPIFGQAPRFTSSSKKGPICSALNGGTAMKIYVFGPRVSPSLKPHAHLLGSAQVRAGRGVHEDMDHGRRLTAPTSRCLNHASLTDFFQGWLPRCPRGQLPKGCLRIRAFVLKLGFYRGILAHESSA